MRFEIESGKIDEFKKTIEQLNKDFPEGDLMLTYTENGDGTVSVHIVKKSDSETEVKEDK